MLNQYYLPSTAPTAQLLADAAEAFAAGGDDVRVICSRREYAEPGATYPSRERHAGVDVTRVRSTGFGRESRAGRIADYLTYLLGAAWRLAFGPRPDVVVAMTTPPMLALVAHVLGRLRRAKTVFWVMDVYPDLAFALGVVRRDSIAGRILRRLARQTLRRADLVVALGETMAEYLRNAGARRVEVVHNWADGEAIRPLALEPHPLRSAWGWEGRFVVLYSGNLGLAHEFRTLLDAAALLISEPRIHFAFVGGGPRWNEAREEAVQLGLPNVEFRPYVDKDELPQSLTAADLHAITLREGLAGLLVPSKVYGVLAAGRPILYVGPAEGEVAAIVAQGGCGSAHAIGDASGVAGTLLEYAGDFERGAREGAQGRTLFDSRFGRSCSLAKLHGLIRGIVAP